MNSQDEAPNRIRIVFLIRSLFYGGAERQLLTLAKGLKNGIFEPIVLCFFSGGDLEPEFLQFGIQVIPLGKSGRWDIFPFLYRLFRQISRLKPEILHSYLPMSNILAVLVHFFFPRIKIVFGVRSSLLDMSKFDLLTRLVYRAEAIVSKHSDLVIVNSSSSKNRQIQNGFPDDRILVIHNGIDTSRYFQSPDERDDFRNRMGIELNTMLVGLIGRLDPVKDHPTFINAAAKVAGSMGQVKFICVGDGEPEYLWDLTALAQELGVSEKVIWLEGQKNVRAVYNSLDICCSASKTESFSNVIAEAMACCTPVVVTDVGDSAVIVGENGMVIPAGDANRMAEAFIKLLSLSSSERRNLGASSRKRIENNFSVERMVKRTETALRNLTKGMNEE